jgi:O-antigen/teichoic acid export membrane protein
MRAGIDAFFDTDTRRFVRNTTLLQASVVATLPLNLAQSIVLARALGPAGLGLIVPVIALVRTISQLCDAGAGDVVVLFGPRYRQQPDDPRQGALIKGAILLSLATGMLAALVSAGVIAVLRHYGWGDPAVGAAGFYFAAAALFSGLDAIATGTLRMTGRFGSVSVLRFASASVSLCVVSGTALLTRSPAAVMIGYAVAEAALTIGACLWMVVAVRDERLGLTRAPLRSIAGDWPELRRYAALNWCSSSGLFANDRADELVAGFVASPAAIGVYKVAKNGFFAVNSIAGSMLDSVGVQIAELWAAGAREKIDRLARRVTAVGLSLAAVGLGVVALFGRDAIAAVYGPPYRDAFWPLIILMGANIYIPALWLFPLLRAAGRIHVVVIAEFTASVISVMAMFAAASRWGIAGVAGGHALFDVALVALAAVYTVRHRGELLGVPPRDRGLAPVITAAIGEQHG